jgi:hypothetical protein
MGCSSFGASLHLMFPIGNVFALGPNSEPWPNLPRVRSRKSRLKCLKAHGEALWLDLAPREHPAASNAVPSSLAFITSLTTTTLSVDVTERNGLPA